VKILGISPVLEMLQRLFPAKELGATSYVPIKQYHVLLLPIVSDRDTTRLVEMATRFPNVQKIVLCYLISVPRAMTLEGAMPEEEEQAGIVLSKMTTQLREQGFDVQTQVRRARTPLEETLKVIQEVGADLLLVSRDAPLDQETTMGMGMSGHLFADSLAQRAPCEVLMLHRP
jgi:nucleotide-binding universal stress UspA family protein